VFYKNVLGAIAVDTTTKYLTDGRKVAVLGKLNNVEYIVQEIFVTAAGEEIPSGENFTAKSLHDTPVESYQTKELAKQKARIADAENQLKDVHKQIKDAKHALHAKRDMLANSPELKALVGDKARILAMFMTGTVNYLVLSSYGRVSAPVAMEDQLICWDSHWSETKYEALKLCSVLGKSNGEIEYRIHHYSDGSGNSNEVFPFETREEAIDHIRSLAVERINNNHLSMDEYEMCVSLGIQFSPEQKEAFCAHHSVSLTQSIANVDGSIAKQQARREEMEQRLTSLREHVLK
jgi:hypothetical protein